MIPHYQVLRHQNSFNNTRCNKLDNLRNVILVINYNSPHYASIPLLKKFYSGLFANIAFCGNTDHPEMVKIDEYHGYLGYACLARIIQLFPGFSGYLYINDDVILNWWNVMHLNTSMIWTGSKIDYRVGHEFGETTLPPWHWWKTLNAAHLCEIAFKQTIKLCKSAEGKRLNLSNCLQTYHKNTNNQKLCVHAWSDVVYIPQQYADAYAKISDIYSSNRVFLEVAVPGILAFLSNRFNFHNLDGLYFHDMYGYSPKFLSGEAFYETYTFDLTFSHPFKLDGAMKAANWNFLKNVVMQYGENVKEYCFVGMSKKRGVT